MAEESMTRTALEEKLAGLKADHGKLLAEFEEAAVGYNEKLTGMSEAIYQTEEAIRLLPPEEPSEEGADG